MQVLPVEIVFRIVSSLQFFWKISIRPQQFKIWAPPRTYSEKNLPVLSESLGCNRQEGRGRRRSGGGEHLRKSVSGGRTVSCSRPLGIGERRRTYRSRHVGATREDKERKESWNAGTELPGIDPEFSEHDVDEVVPACEEGPIQKSGKLLEESDSRAVTEAEGAVAVVEEFEGGVQEEGQDVQGGQEIGEVTLPMSKIMLEAVAAEL